MPSPPHAQPSTIRTALLNHLSTASRPFPVTFPQFFGPAFLPVAVRSSSPIRRGPAPQNRPSACPWILQTTSLRHPHFALRASSSRAPCARAFCRPAPARLSVPRTTSPGFLSTPSLLPTLYRRSRPRSYLYLQYRYQPQPRIPRNARCLVIWSYLQLTSLKVRLSTRSVAPFD